MSTSGRAARPLSAASSISTATPAISAPRRESRRKVAARVQQIVDHEHPRAARDGVGMDLDRIRAVFQRIFFGEFLAGQFAGLADGDETRAQRVGDRRAEHVPAGLDSHHILDPGVAIAVGEEVDHGPKAGRIAQQRGDVAEQNAGDGKIRNSADQTLELHAPPFALPGREPRDALES